MIKLLLNNLKNFYFVFLQTPQNLSFTHHNTFPYSSKLNNKSGFKNILNFSSTIIFNLFSFQKIDYIGLHVVSAARWVKIRVSYALNS
jgi:hypothetical protein